MTILRIPFEGEPVSRGLLAWPHRADHWPDRLRMVQEEIAAMAEAATGEGGAPVTLFVATDEALVTARKHLGHLEAGKSAFPLEFARAPYGDIWLRDIAPMFALQTGVGGETSVTGLNPRFNGWGGKYQIEGDTDFAKACARHFGFALRPVDLVTEGGAWEFDGEGTALSTRICLINDNRNPGVKEAGVTQAFEAAGARFHTLWLDDGLAFDHTDGHIDNLARFIAPGRVAIAEAATQDDPNAELYEAVAGELSGFRDAKGRALEVVRMPSPGLVADDDGQALPVSYANWWIVNRRVLVPQFGVPADAEALETIAGFFPDRQIIGVNALTLVSLGGGGVHCASNAIPAIR